MLCVTIKKTMTALVAVSIAAIVVGCSSEEKAQPGYEKKDFQKSGPPPQYRGPGQPGGPDSGPISGPPPGAATTGK